MQLQGPGRYGAAAETAPLTPLLQPLQRALERQTAVFMPALAALAQMTVNKVLQLVDSAGTAQICKVRRSKKHRQQQY